jgi:type II secretory pathway pseudopilin PulG
MNLKEWSKTKLKAFSLIELLAAISIFTLVVGGLAYASLNALESVSNDRRRVEAILYLKEVTNAIFINKNDLWSSIADETGQGTKSVQFVNNKYEIIDGSSTEGDVTVGFTVENVYRDENGNLVESGGTIDLHSRKIVMTVSWTSLLGSTFEITDEIYLNNWSVRRLEQTTAAEFNAGTYDLTRLYSPVFDDGEVELEEVFYSDWCNPALSLNSYDIPGNATAKTIFAEDTVAHIGTGGSTDGVAYTKAVATSDLPPVVNVEGEWDGEKVNDIYVMGDYAYLATDNNSTEVIILDISSLPYTPVGSVNVSGSRDADDVIVDERGVGYVTAGPKIYAFDVGYTAGNPSSSTANSGVRSVLDDVSVVWFLGSVEEIDVLDGYVYAGLNNDWYELGIVDAQDPGSLSLISQTTVSYQQVKTLYISEDGTKTYIGTNSSGESEVWIMDTTTKSGERPVIGEIETNGTTVLGLFVVEQDNRLILGGSGGNEYQVYDISDENNPTLCGSLNLPSQVNDLVGTSDPEQSVYSYLVVDDSSAEFKIIRGGPGGGGGNGTGYVYDGTFTSSVIDMEEDDPHYFSFGWLAQLPSGTDLQAQIRTSDSPDPSGEPWYGPSGVGTFYTSLSEGFQIDPAIQDKRYLQYRIYLSTSDISVSPLFESFEIVYEDNE